MSSPPPTRTDGFPAADPDRGSKAARLGSYFVSTGPPLQAAAAREVP